MSYFSARIAIGCLMPGPIPEEGYSVDVQVHVFTAKSIEEAKQTAIEIGKSEEHSYDNQYGEKVTWKFLRIENITRLGDALDRTQVSTRMEAWMPSGPVKANLSLDEICSNIEYFDETTP